MSEWRPIETAPKDGTAILAIHREWWAPVNGNHRWIYGKVYQTAFAHGKFDAGCMKQPTHWMPLPAPSSSDHRRDTDG